MEVLCEDSPARVGELQALGVRFDADRRGALALGLEGGHSARRIVHAGGAATGRRITRQLSAVAATHERIDVMEHTTVTALLVDGGRCLGVSAERDGAALELVSRATVLATGGAAALWARTTNPRGSIGVGPGAGARRRRRTWPTSTSRSSIPRPSCPTARGTGSS